MNPIDDQLQRLFRAAAQVRPGEVAPPAFGLETRALAAWRAGRAGGGDGLWDMTLLFRGLIAASAIMAISFLPALKSAPATTVATTTAAANPYADFVQLADSTVSSDDAP